MPVLYNLSLIIFRLKSFILYILLIPIRRNGSKDGPEGLKGRIWEEKRIALIYRKGQVFIYL
jgi:hypothetical protein